jgi:uncharacterized protein
MCAKKKSSKPESLTEKYQKQQLMDIYIDDVPEITESEIKKAFFPDVRIPLSGGTKALKVTCDSSNGTIGLSECEYSGPIPLGFRETPPQSLPLKGVVGKFLKHFAARNFYIGDQLNGWFMQNCFIYKACAMPGDDAVSCGYDIAMRGAKDKALIEGMMDKFNSESFNLDETMRTFELYKRGFGGALMIPCFDEKVDMESPLVDYGQLRGKTFIGWTIIEPYYLCPEIESGSREATDPTYKYYMNPTHWNVYGGKQKRIHRSWCFFRRHMTTVKIYQPMYKYFGPSVPQMVIERLYSAEVCANESSMLLRSKRAFVIEADVRKMAANPQYAEKFLKNCQGNSDNWGVRVVPRNSQAKQMDTYLTECTQMTTAQYGILCAEIDIPAPKFMMAQLQGFANSGNYEIKLYSANVKKIQDQDLKQLVAQTARIEAATKGKVDLKFDINFGEIDLPTIVEQGKIMYEEARSMKFREEAKAIKKGATQDPNNHKGTLELHGNQS